MRGSPGGRSPPHPSPENGMWDGPCGPKEPFGHRGQTGQGSRIVISSRAGVHGIVMTDKDDPAIRGTRNDPLDVPRGRIGGEGDPAGERNLFPIPLRLLQSLPNLLTHDTRRGRRVGLDQQRERLSPVLAADPDVRVRATPALRSYTVYVRSSESAELPRTSLLRSRRAGDPETRRIRLSV